MDSQGNLINNFDDKEFWENIVNIVQDINEEQLSIDNLSINNSSIDNSSIKFYDSDLDNHIDKPWFILDNSGVIYELTEDEKKNRINPLSSSIPLTSLIVRFDTNYDSFMKNI